MTLPISYVFSLSYYIVPIVPFIFYAMASLELIAEEIEEPFGRDANDLPISKICDKINTHIQEILDWNRPLSRSSNKFSKSFKLSKKGIN